MKFDKPRGQRLHKQFIWITNHDNLWYVDSEKRWMCHDEIPELVCYSTCCDCRSIKAFKRHLRKHPEIRGKAILVSRFKGFNVYA